MPSLNICSVSLSLWNLSFQQEELNPEEQLAEKLRLKKLQEESDLELTNDAFGRL